MIIISHRGNTTGPNTAAAGENHPKSIQYVLQQGFYAEVDVWWEDRWLLGHDKGTYPVSDEFFFNDHLFVHCKNIPAMIRLRPHPLINAFFHQNDDITILSNSKQVWHYPNDKIALEADSIAVMPEIVGEWAGIEKCWGICTDNPILYKEK